jgi:signal peptidase II
MCLTANWPRPRWIFWVLGGFLLSLDRWSKHLVLQHFWLGQSREIVPGLLNFTYVRNDGMAFGLFQGRNFLLGTVVLGILAGMWWWSRKLNWNKREVNVVAAMVLSGAIGNLIDRVRFGYVVDFVDAYLGAYHWPVFNVADSCISLSMVWILFRMWKSDQASIEKSE